MHFIHELTGSVASFAAYALVATGLALYFFKYVRKVYQFDRKLAVKAHQYLVLLFIIGVAGHYFSTDKSNFFVIAGLAGFLFVALTGTALRVKKLKAKYFKKVIAVKVAALVLTAALLFAGHALLEKDRKHEESSAPRTVALR